MSSALLTQEELEALLDAVVREARASLRLNAVGHFRREHDAFCDRLALLLGRALDTAGYAWARRPKDHDELYRVLVAAAGNAGSAHRIGLASEDERVGSFSRALMAQHMMETLRTTGTVVVRRKSGKKAG